MIDVFAPLLPLYVAVPLMAAAVSVALRKRRTIRHVISLSTVIAIFASAICFVVVTHDGSVMAHNVGQWEYGIAIPFVVDAFSALMMMIVSLLAIACMLFAMGTHEARARFYHPFVLVLMGGACGALMTGDIFNLFVFVEVMLLPSYGLLSMMGAKLGSHGPRLYVTVNLLASTMLLSGVALIYGTAGTVNLALLQGAAKEDPAVAIAGGVMLTALAIKAAVFPMHGWLSRTYPMTSPSVTALFSGIHTKVAIYAIYRVYGFLFDGDARFLWIALLLTSLTMIVGVLGAIGEGTTRSILVYHMVSQIGYILIGVGLFTELGLTAAIFYLLHHMVVKASLFLSTGAIEETYGTGELSQLGGMLKREPWVAATFMVAALSLAGMPPFSGFVAKFTIIWATLQEGHIWVAAAAIVVSILTLLSMLKIWNGVFMGPEPKGLERRARQEQLLMHGKRYLRVQSDQGAALKAGLPTTMIASVIAGRKRLRVPVALIVPGALLACVTVFFGLGAELLMSLSETAAMNLLDPSAYVEAVSRG